MADIRAIEPMPSTSAVETLEATLQLARSGEVVAVAIAETYRDGGIGARWSTSPRWSSLMGSIARLAHRFNTAKDVE